MALIAIIVNKLLILVMRKFCHLRKSIDTMMLHTERSFLLLRFSTFLRTGQKNVTKILKNAYKVKLQA